MVDRNQQRPLTKVSAAEFDAKYSGKREVYRFLSSEVHAYLPGYEALTVWHLRDLAASRRTIIKDSAVKVLAIPQFEGLAVDDLLGYAQNYPAVLRALPIEEKEVLKLPRAYIGNVIYTLVGQPFANWVEERVTARNEKLADERDMMIEMDPAIAEIFRKSTSVSGKYQQASSRPHLSESCLCWRRARLATSLSNSFSTCSLQGHQQQPDEGLS
jgi:hypothetical protein